MAPYADADEADFQAELHRTRDMMARAQAGCYGSVPPREPARGAAPTPPTAGSRTYRAN